MNGFERMYYAGFTKPFPGAVAKYQEILSFPHVIANATLIAKNFLKELKGLEVRGSVLNLFNKQYIVPTGSGMLPDDIPMPGINFFLELRYTF